MPTRPLLPDDHVLPQAARRMAEFHADTVARVRDAISAHDVVVVGMAQNPHVRTARRALAEAAIAFEYIEIGSYLSGWKPRLAIKLYTGWPTFPQVFVRGRLLGGAHLTQIAIADGSLREMLQG